MKIPFTLFLVFVTTLSYAQDLIVKTNNDSVHCKVIKQTNETIFFFTYQNNEEITNALKMSDVKKIIIDYYASNDSTYKKSNTQNTTTPNKPYSTNRNVTRKQYDKISGYRIAGNYGYAHLLMNVSDVNNPIIKEYLLGLKSSSAFSASMNYYGKRNLGFGVKYMNLQTTNSIDNVIIYNSNGTVQSGKMLDDITMQYFGLSLGYRLPLQTNNKWRMIFDWGYGYQSYVNEAILVNPVTITTSTIAVSYEIGIDYSVSKNFALGLTGLLVGAGATEYTYDYGSHKTTVKVPDNKQDNLGRVEFTFGLRYLIE